MWLLHNWEWKVKKNEHLKWNQNEKSVKNKGIIKMGLPINDSDSISRVPETHAEISIEDEKLLSDLYIRTSWFDAALALDQIEKVS